jgi:hypothetical protein
VNHDGVVPRLPQGRCKSDSRGTPGRITSDLGPERVAEREATVRAVQDGYTLCLSTHFVMEIRRVVRCVATLRFRCGLRSARLGHEREGPDCRPGPPCSPGAPTLGEAPPAPLARGTDGQQTRYRPRCRPGQPPIGLHSRRLGRRSRSDHLSDPIRGDPLVVLGHQSTVALAIGCHVAPLSWTWRFHPASVMPAGVENLAGPRAGLVSVPGVPRCTTVSDVRGGLIAARLGRRCRDRRASGGHPRQRTRLTAPLISGRSSPPGAGLPATRVVVRVRYPAGYLRGRRLRARSCLWQLTAAPAGCVFLDGNAGVHRRLAGLGLSSCPHLEGTPGVGPVGYRGCGCGGKLGDKSLGAGMTRCESWLWPGISPRGRGSSSRACGTSTCAHGKGTDRGAHGLLTDAIVKSRSRLDHLTDRHPLTSTEALRWAPV